MSVDRSIVLYGNTEPRCTSATCAWPKGVSVSPERIEAFVTKHVNDTSHTVMVVDVAAVRYTPASA